MTIPIKDFTGKEPRLDECRTERIAEDVSRCLSNNSTCKYGLPAGYTTTYCLHPNHRDFQHTPFLGSPRTPTKAITKK